ncbi:MAG TPA: cyanophycin synthetase [Polyangiaceae bacterium]|nr:cyanophycin synthetase [Polyangiaceae bacterium]
MQIRALKRLVGPSIWANYPVLEAWVDLGKYEDFPSNTLPGFNDKLMRWLPTMVEHRCSIGERGGFFQRMETGTWLGHVLEHVTLEIQSLAHSAVGFGRARETSERGVYKVAIEVLDFRFGEACLNVAHEMILAAAEGRDYDLPAALGGLRKLADDYCYGPSTQAIVDGAKKRNIPTLRLTEGNLVQLGYGKAQRRIWTAETDSTSAVAESIAHDKQLTRQLLTSVGVPVPVGRIVTSAEDAWAAAQEVGLPVVVKPQRGNKGRGVSIQLTDREAVLNAYAIAEREFIAQTVVLERCIPGRQHRVLVVGDRAVATSGGQPQTLRGDGVHTIVELVAIGNQDPLRGEDAAQPLSPFVLDAIALDLLRHQGLSDNSVLAPGATAILRHNGDLTIDETDRLNPETAEQCVLAARSVGLDVAGIDLIAEDISQPLDAQGGAVIEVNSSPGLIMHLKPLVGSPRPVGDAIIGQLFGSEQTGRVPLCAVSGSNGKTVVSALIADILRASGRNVGEANSHELRVGQRLLGAGDRCNEASMRRALMNPYADAFVFEISEPNVLDEGLIFDRCEVAVVTNLGSGDHLGKKYVDELITINKAVRAPVDIVLPTGYAVLNADDASVLEMAAKTKGKVLLFSSHASTPALIEHLKHDGRAVVRDGDQLMLRHGATRIPLLELSTLRCPVLGLPAFLVEDLLAAVAGAIALGVSAEHIRAGLGSSMGQGSIATFELPKTATRPNGGLLVLTPARNLSALEAWGRHLQEQFPGRRAQLLVDPPADWRAADAEPMLAQLNQWFSSVTIALNSDAQSFVEACEMTRPGTPHRPQGQSCDLAAHLDQMLDAPLSADLVCVCPANSAGFLSALRHLETKGLSRGISGGLASVRHSR